MKLIDAFLATLSPSPAEIEAELNERLALRKAARKEKNPAKRGHITRWINGTAK